jgi:hypothetical protein
MSELQTRGYITAFTSDYVRKNLSADEWKAAVSRFSPGLQKVVSGDVKHAGWYPVSMMCELHSVIATTIAHNDVDRARQAFINCGKYVASEATNTFLKMLLKMLSPSMFAKKLPDVFKRDFQGGARMETELDGHTITCRIYDMPGFDHCGATAPGFVAAAFEAMGKKVEAISVHEWSLERPNVDGVWFELTWKD